VKLPSLPVRVDKAERRVKEYGDAGVVGVADALKGNLDNEKRKLSAK